MHYKILYNPLSKGGSNKKVYTKLKKYLENKKHKVDVSSILEIKNVKEYLDNLDEDIKVIIIGGDGTLHHLANALIKYEVKNEIFAIKKAGTGNDFIRSLKSKDKLIKINDFLRDIPYDNSDELNTDNRYFLNSTGMGVDAYIGYVAEKYQKNKSRWSYFKSVYRGFVEFKPYELTLEIDGKKETFEKTWLAVVANSPYFGGGMKIAPKANRQNDEFEIVVIHGLRKFFVLLLFPLIYVGWHKIFKKWVKTYKGKYVKFESNRDIHIQYDGEVIYPRRKIDAYK